MNDNLKILGGFDEDFADGYWYDNDAGYTGCIFYGEYGMETNLGYGNCDDKCSNLTGKELIITTPEEKGSWTDTVYLHQPPYEDENILNKTGWKSDHVTITEITPKFEGEE